MRYWVGHDPYTIPECGKPAAAVSVGSGTSDDLHELMQELESIVKTVPMDEKLLVLDAMTGQEAVNVAQGFNERVPINGLIMTKIDGDARGGAALSVRQVTGVPIKFLGTGEKLPDIEPFQPDRLAGRILGMGDVLTLIEKAQSAISEEDAAIGDLVWTDDDADGIQDGGEAGLGGVTVTATSTALQGARETLTDVLGRYIVANLPPGTYYLHVFAYGDGENSYTLDYSATSAGCSNAKDASSFASSTEGAIAELNAPYSSTRATTIRAKTSMNGAETRRIERVFSTWSSP